jgi:hypothetical protein
MSAIIHTWLHNVVHKIMCHRNTRSSPSLPPTSSRRRTPPYPLPTSASSSSSHKDSLPSSPRTRSPRSKTILKSIPTPAEMDMVDIPILSSLQRASISKIPRAPLLCQSEKDGQLDRNFMDSSGVSGRRCMRAEPKSDVIACWKIDSLTEFIQSAANRVSPLPLPSTPTSTPLSPEKRRNLQDSRPSRRTLN